MNAVDMLKERRSVRKYKQEKVDRKVMEEIVDMARFAPSWANFQIARYNVVDDEATILKISEEGLLGFSYNIGTIKNARGVVILSFVKGKSGTLQEGNYATTKGNDWEVFDAGIACQTFCLAAHQKGVGTCIFGVIDDRSLAKIANIPDNETVAALITYGYPEGETPTPPRKNVDELLRFID